MWPKVREEGAKNPAIENIHTNMGRECMVGVIQGGALDHAAKMVIAKVSIQAGTMVTCFGETAVVWEQQGGRELDEMIQRQLRLVGERFQYTLKYHFAGDRRKFFFVPRRMSLHELWGTSEIGKSAGDHGT